MTLSVAGLLGVLIGLSLGALGGGGSILTVPALVYALGEPARAATTESLVIVGLTALAATVGHARVGHVRWATGLGLGLAGLVASVLGTALNRSIDPDLLLLAFAGLTTVAGVALLLRDRPTDQPPPAEPARRPARTAVRVVVAGLAVGFLTGFFGVGGGFVIVPALVMVLDLSMPVAIGTSLLVIAVNSATALLARAGHQSFHWAVIAPFTIAAIAASLAGRRLSVTISPVALTRGFVVLLFGVSGYMALRSGVQLAT